MTNPAILLLKMMNLWDAASQENSGVKGDVLGRLLFLFKSYCVSKVVAKLGVFDDSHKEDQNLKGHCEIMLAMLMEKAPALLESLKKKSKVGVTKSKKPKAGASEGKRPGRPRKGAQASTGESEKEE